MAAPECDPDPRLAAASRLTDLLDGIGDWPLRVQAIEVARELCTNAVA